MVVSKRQQRIAASNAKQLLSHSFEQVDLSKRNFVPRGMTRAFVNNKYMVMIYDNAQTTHGPAIQVLIQNHKNTPLKNHWREIQNIKNSIFGEEVTAIEYFPAESKLIDNYNIYWIFIFPDGIIPHITDIK